MLQSFRQTPARLQTIIRRYSTNPQFHAPSASDSASSAAQPLSTPATPSPQPIKMKKKVAQSSCAEGTVLKNLNIFKTGSDPVAKADAEYPDFLWTILQEDKTDKKAVREKNRATIKRKNFFSGKL